MRGERAQPLRLPSARCPRPLPGAGLRSKPAPNCTGNGPVPLAWRGLGCAGARGRTCEGPRGPRRLRRPPRRTRCRPSPSGPGDRPPGLPSL